MFMLADLLTLSEVTLSVNAGHPWVMLWVLGKALYGSQTTLV
jgi:hypothetical protein